MDAEGIAGEWFWLCGSSSGIGLGVARALAKRGARLVLMARDPGKLARAAEEVTSVGAGEVRTITLDLRDRATPERAASFALALGRPLRGLLLNGGGPEARTIRELSRGDYETAHELLLLGPALLAGALVERMRAPGGSIVAITSTTVTQPNAALPLSAAYRAGFVAWLKHLADELGPKGVRVNNVAPGYVATQRLEELCCFEALSRYGRADGAALAEVRASWAKLAPMARLASPDEIGEVCAFLLSSRASFVTGLTLTADGGQVRHY